MKQHTKFLWGTTDSVGDMRCQKIMFFSRKKPKINENLKFQKIVTLLKIYVGITIVKKHTKFH